MEDASVSWEEGRHGQAAVFFFSSSFSSQAAFFFPGKSKRSVVVPVQPGPPGELPAHAWDLLSLGFWVGWQLLLPFPGGKIELCLFITCIIGKSLPYLLRLSCLFTRHRTQPNSLFRGKCHSKWKALGKGVSMPPHQEEND